MTKRILAAFLAVMMVVGILPVSVFATDSDAVCAVLAQYPDHSKEHCTNAGVAYTVIPNSTVEPKCGQDGYTLYQCACGEYFADDIVDMDPHYTESGEPKTARVEPTCYATGKIAVYVCDKCGEEYFNPEDLLAENVDKNGVIAKTQHTFDDVTYPGNDCTAAEQVCQNEGCTAKNEDYVSYTEHDWEYDDPHAIVKAPTAHEAGEAVFYCSRHDICNQPKTVEVHALNHKDAMTLVEAVAPDCKNKGNIEYWHCDVCDKNYVEDAQGNLIEEDDVVLDEVHQWNTDPVIIPAECETWGFSYYGCPLCGATKGVTPETEDDDMTKYKPLGHTGYVCEEHTEAVDGCVYCAAAATYEYVAPTCEVDGAHTWNCGRCGEPHEPDKETATGHAAVTVIVPQTHKFAYTYTYTFCTNAHCDRALVESFTFAEGDYANVEFDVTVEVREDGHVYDLPAGTSVHLIEAPTAIAMKTSDFVHFFVEDKAVQAPTCTDPGKAFWYCAGDNGCNTYYDEVLDPLGHDYSDTTNDIAATCDTNAYKTCDRAGCDHEEEQKNTALGHKMVKVNTVLPLCDGTKGYSEYECSVCGEPEQKDKTSFVANKTYLGVAEIVLADVKTSLTAKEEFEMEHPDFDGTYEEYRKGDCLNNGYWKAYCDGCEKTYLVLIDDTGKGHKIPDGTVYHEEATCYVAQGYETYVCERATCGAVVTNPNNPLDHVMTETKAKAATCTEDGNLAYWTCSNKCCEGKLFKDEAGVAEFAKDEQIVLATGHAYEDTTVEVNCTTPGFTHHICNNCGDEYVDGYVAPTGHKRGENVSVTARCITDGCISYKCANAGCTGDDGIAGTDDDGIESYQRTYATGHKNSAGQIITNICTDTVTDRHCVSCNWYTPCNGNNACAGDVEKNENGKWIVKKDHAVTTVIVGAGCEHYGYEMETCANGCGTMDKVINLVEPTGHLAPWGQYIKADDMTVINEDVCGWYGEQFLNTDPEDYTGAVTAYTAPTYEALGSITFKCCGDPHCNDEITRDVIRTGVDFTIWMDNAAVSGANTNEDGDFIPVDGDVIAVEIYANAYNTNIWGFNFDLNYSAYSLKYLGYKFDAKDIFANYKVNNLMSDETYYEDVNNDGVMELLGLAEDYYGEIKVSAYTENGMDGKINDAAVNGTIKVVTLYFQVETQYTYTEMGIEVVDFDNDIFVDMEDYDEAEHEYVWTGTVVNSEGEIESTGDWYYTDATKMLDTNGSNSVNITDLYNCNQILTGESEFEYLASADANKDGQITLTDLELMNQLLQGADESVIYAALKWTAPEGFVAA